MLYVFAAEINIFEMWKNVAAYAENYDARNILCA